MAGSEEPKFDPAEPTGDVEGYRVAFEAGLHRVDSLLESLKELRERVGRAVTAGGVVVGLAVNLAGRGKVTRWGWVALITVGATFFVMILNTVRVWRSAPGNWTLSPGRIVADFVDGSPGTTACIGNSRCISARTPMVSPGTRKAASQGW